MAKPTSKATLKEYCLRKLGKPVLEVNVSDDQIDDAIDYTLQKFNEFHFDGVERVYLKHQFTQAEIDAAKSNTTVGTVGGFVYSEMQNYFQPTWQYEFVSKKWIHQFRHGGCCLTTRLPSTKLICNVAPMQMN